MAVWSVVKISELGPHFRIDSEYYRPSILHMLDELRKRGTNSLSPDHAIIRKTRFAPRRGSSFAYVEIGGVSTTLGTYDPLEISDDHAPSRAQYVVKPGDILVSQVRPNRSAVALIPAGIDRTICSSGFAVIQPISVSSEFLFAYFKTPFITELLSRDTTATMYPAVGDNDIRRLPFVIPSDRLVTAVTEKVKQAFSHLAHSKDVYTQAVRLLLSELGLGDSDMSPTLFYTQSYSEVRAIARLDAEFFMPKYYRLLTLIGRCRFGHTELGSMVAPIRNGYDFREFTDDGLPYIRVGDVNNGRIEIENAQRIPIRWSDIRKDIRLRIGDVIITRKGSYGNAAFVRSGQEDSVISSEIMLLRLKERHIRPEYLTVYLNTPIGTHLVERCVHGTAFYSISQNALASLPIIVPPLKLQENIVALVLKSDSARDKSRRLLGEAKQMVEAAILGGE